MKIVERCLQFVTENIIRTFTLTLSDVSFDRANFGSADGGITGTDDDDIDDVRR
jgi:hypothetical protein